MDFADRGWILKNQIVNKSGIYDIRQPSVNMSFGVSESSYIRPGGSGTVFKQAGVEVLEGLSAFSRFSRAGLAGAGFGLGLSGIGWLGKKMTGGDISSEGPVSSILKGAAIGTTAMGASYGFEKLAQVEGSLVKPWMNTVGKIGAGRFGAIGLGIGAAALTAKSILGTSLTRKSN